MYVHVPTVMVTLMYKHIVLRVMNAELGKYWNEMYPICRVQNTSHNTLNTPHSQVLTYYC